MLLIAYEVIGVVHLKIHKFVLKIVFVYVLKFRIVFIFLSPCHMFIYIYMGTLQITSKCLAEGPLHHFHTIYHSILE